MTTGKDGGDRSVFIAGSSGLRRGFGVGHGGYFCTQDTVDVSWLAGFWTPTDTPPGAALPEAPWLYLTEAADASRAP